MAPVSSIKSAAIPHPEIFSHRDLDAVDMGAVPDRFEHRIREPRIKYVLHRLLAKVVVNPEDAFFREKAVENAVELARGTLCCDRTVSR